MIACVFTTASHVASVQVAITIRYWAPCTSGKIPKAFTRSFTSLPRMSGLISWLSRPRRRTIPRSHPPLMRPVPLRGPRNRSVAAHIKVVSCLCNRRILVRVGTRDEIWSNNSPVHSASATFRSAVAVRVRVGGGSPHGRQVVTLTSTVRNNCRPCTVTSQVCASLSLNCLAT